MKWLAGHRLDLLEDGDAFFPRVFEAIDAARVEILIETFILFEDEVGLELQRRLVAAARRGVRVMLTADGYGSAELSPDFVQAMVEAGIRFRLYDPQPRFLRVRTNLFRRLHRKLIVIDTECGFVGGINFSADHICAGHPRSKRDYAVGVRGPVCAVLREVVMALPAAEAIPAEPWPQEKAASDGKCSGGVDAALVLRDNARHPSDIEASYLAGLRLARSHVLIANAYFFPGWRLLRALRQAARRGVRVELILQGRPDMPLVRRITTVLHDTLLRAGVHLYDYTERPLHAKAAVIDGRWCTVGSSNLDPLSLYLNLEANLLVQDASFAGQLGDRLARMRDEHCRPVEPLPPARFDLGRRIISFVSYHLVRRFPRIAGWFPAHTSQGSRLFLQAR